MNTSSTINDLVSYLNASVSPYHCILESSRILSEQGFEQLALTGNWEIKPGHGYYIPVYDSTLLAFTVGDGMTDRPSLRLAAGHTDWPGFKVKPDPETVAASYGKLRVEVYGGPILNTWLDRPLSMAGKVCTAGDTPMEPKIHFIDVQRPVVTIPNLAIHLNHEVNKGVELQPQKDLLPLLTLITEELDRDHFFLNLLAEEAGCKAEDILDYEIYLYNLDVPAVTGLHGEFLSAPRLDNLTSCHGCLKALTSGFRTNGINLIALYDNEEIGNNTKQGALSTVTDRVLEKLFASLGYDRQTYLNALMDGFLLSVDVAQAAHPNHLEKYDAKNQVFLGDGVAVKMAYSQAYCTDATALAAIEGLCRSFCIPHKKYTNRADAKGGSTLGKAASVLLSMKGVDIGVPLLAMHSARELMGCADQDALIALISKFFLV